MSIHHHNQDTTEMYRLAWEKSASQLLNIYKVLGPKATADKTALQAIMQMQSDMKQLAFELRWVYVGENKPMSKTVERLIEVGDAAMDFHSLIESKE